MTKRQKIEALVKNGATEGERAAARAALERMGPEQPKRPKRRATTDPDADRAFSDDFFGFGFAQMPEEDRRRAKQAAMESLICKLEQHFAHDVRATFLRGGL